MPADGAKTRSKASDMANVEFQSYLHSDAFKEVISNAVKEAVAAALLSIINPLEERIAALEAKAAKADDLEKSIARLSIKCNDNEQYSRRQNVRIYGFIEEEGEDCIKKIVDLSKGKMDIRLEASDIDKAHRVGKPRLDKPRAIIVKFKSHSDKTRLIKARKNLKGSVYYINEDLTKVNQELLFTARKNCTFVSSAWSIDGKIFAKRSQDNTIFRIIEHADFAQFGLTN